MSFKKHAFLFLNLDSINVILKTRSRIKNCSRNLWLFFWYSKNCIFAFAKILGMLQLKWEAQNWTDCPFYISTTYIHHKRFFLVSGNNDLKRYLVFRQRLNKWAEKLEKNLYYPWIVPWRPMKCVIYCVYTSK